jgi:cytosine/adenosine deaminase-related metal-dependent hydrolase
MTPGPILLRGGTLLTLDASARVLPGTDLLLVDGRIAALAPTSVPAGTRVVQLAGDLVLPGFVQGHVHLGQTLFRGLGEGRRLLDWLRQRIWPLEAAHDDESAYWGALVGAAELLLGGTTTIQDIGIGPGAAGMLRAIQESRLRGYAGMCLMDAGDGVPAGLLADTDRALADTEAMGLALAGSPTAGSEPPRLRYVLCPRFILSCSDPLWAGVRDLAARHGWPVHTHGLEQRDETAAVVALKGGRDEVAYFADTGILATDFRLAHGVWLSDDHLRAMRGRRCSVVHCPSSNLKLGSGIADLPRIRSAGVPVGLGADGAPCNNNLDALTEVKLAALLQKVTHGPLAFSGLDALRLATSEGAQALGLAAEVGSLEVGKQADVVVLAVDRPEMMVAPDVDPHDRVAFGAGRAGVRHVFIGGEQLVADGRLTQLDLPNILRQSAQALADLLRRARL